MKKILFFITEDSFFCSHRLELAEAVAKSGYKVAVATRCKNHIEIIENAGIEVFPLKYFKRSSMNIVREALTLFELFKIYRNYQPNIVHNVAIKPVVYGSIVAKLAKVPCIVNALAGLGYLFTNQNSKQKFNIKKTVLQKVVRIIFKNIFKSPISHVILQNQDDLKTLTEAKCIDQNKIYIIPGSGISLEKYKVAPPPPAGPIKIVMVSRMLKDKGVLELIAAAEILKKTTASFEIHLYGDPDPENPTSITQEQLLKWQNDSLAYWHGHSNNVAKVYESAHIAVLPSYREGLPRALLEASACGRPIVTTDAPGCKDVVKHDFNGLLTPVGDATALASALLDLIQNTSKREKMGENGRTMIKNYFANNIIHKQFLELYDKLILL